MSNPSAPKDYQGKLVGPLAIIFDLGLTAIFFLCLWRVCYSHTPDFSEFGKQVSAAYCALSLTGVFWLCLQGFRVTIVDQIRRKKAGLQS